MHNFLDYSQIKEKEWDIEGFLLILTYKYSN